jgi:hypothetical protein
MIKPSQLRIARHAAQSVLEGLSCLLTLVAAALGGLLGFYATHVALGASSLWGAVIAGVAGLVVGAGADSLIVDPVLRPLFRLTSTAGTSSTATGVASGSSDNVLDRLAQVVRADAAQAAMNASWRLDRGHELLNNDAAAWQGAADGTATFDLGNGAHLKYADSDGQPTFTFATENSDASVIVTSALQLRELVQQHVDRTSATAAA